MCNNMLLLFYLYKWRSGTEEEEDELSTLALDIQEWIRDVKSKNEKEEEQKSDLIRKVDMDSKAGEEMRNKAMLRLSEKVL